MDEETLASQIESLVEQHADFGPANTVILLLDLAVDVADRHIDYLKRTRQGQVNGCEVQWSNAKKDLKAFIRGHENSLV
jgi:hypothetical protein